MAQNTKNTQQPLMNPTVYHTHVLKSFCQACGINAENIDSRTISSSSHTLVRPIAAAVTKFNNHGEIDITNKEKFVFQWIYHPWAMNDGIIFDIRPTIKTQLYERFSHISGNPDNLNGDLTLIVKHRGGWDISRLMIINGKWENGLLTDDNAQIIYCNNNFKKQYIIHGIFKHSIFIKGTIYSYSSCGNSMLCRFVKKLETQQLQNNNDNTIVRERLEKDIPLKHEYDSNYNKHFSDYCGRKTEKSRCKQKCTISDFEISTMLLEDKIAFIKTTIVPNILEIEGYDQVRVPTRWKSAANNVYGNWVTLLQCGAYTSLVDYFSYICMSFVSGDGDELINGKIIKYASQQNENGNSNQINNNNNNNNSNDKRRIEMEIRVVPGEKDNRHKFCRMVVHSRSFVLNEKKQETVKADKHETMKNGIIEYYSSFNQLSNNYASCLMDNSKYIGYIYPTKPIYSECSFNGWGEIYAKNCNDKSNEYTLICKCRFKHNKVLLSSIIDSCYRETVGNFIKQESGNQSNINEDIMFSNKDYYTNYVENELQARIIEQISHIVKYQRNKNDILANNMIDDKTDMFETWLPIMNINSKHLNIESANLNDIDVSSLADIKVNFLKSLCLQIENLLKHNNNNNNYINNNKNGSNGFNPNELRCYVPFSRLFYESEMMKAFSCRNNAFIQYLIDKKIISTINSFHDVTKSFNSNWNLLHFVCESGNNDLFKQVLSKMKQRMTLRQSKLKQQADYQKLLQRGKRKRPRHFNIPDNPANMLLRCCSDTDMTPLHLACINGNFNIILKIFDKILSSNHFSNGAPSKRKILDQKTHDGWNLLGLSIIYDDNKIFEYLVKNHGIYYQVTNVSNEIKFGDKLGSLNGFSVVELAFENESWNVLDYIFSKYISQWINDITNFEKGILRNEKTLKDKDGRLSEGEIAMWTHRVKLFKRGSKKKQCRLFNFYHIKFNNGMDLEQKLCNLSMRQDGQEWQTWIDKIEHSLAGYSG